MTQRVEDFFSASVTHFITNKPVPTPEDIAALENKENAPDATTSMNGAPRSVGSRSQSAAPPLLRSPIKLRLPTNKYDALVTKAVHFNMKMWDEKSKCKFFVPTFAEWTYRSSFPPQNLTIFYRDSFQVLSLSVPPITKTFILLP